MTIPNSVRVERACCGGFRGDAKWFNSEMDGASKVLDFLSVLIVTKRGFMK